MNDQFLIFDLAEQRCALPLSQVERVVRAVEVTPIAPGEAAAASSLCGMINVHGAIVPVFDLRPAGATGLDDQMILIGLDDGRRAALLCDRVEGVRETPPQSLASSRALLPDAQGKTAGNGGVIKDETGLIHLQDIEALITQSADAVAALLKESA